MKNELRLSCSSPEELPEIAKKLLDFAGKTRVFLLYAPMGAGKTTLIKELCKCLGSHDHFSSPTFSIVNEYKSNAGKIYHFDLYRLKHQEELMDLGIEEYLASGAYCFFEWPDLVKDLLEAPAIKIEIESKQNIRYFCAFKS